MIKKNTFRESTTRFFFSVLLIIVACSLPVSCIDTNELNKSQSSQILSSEASSQVSIPFEVSYDSFYEIRFVSNELLDNILSNSNPSDVVLKIGPGMTIGIATPHVLYLRSDLQSDEYLLKNRNMTDMKEDITQHLLDISFGRDNSNITLMKSDLKYMIWFDAIYTQRDIESALQFARMFNNLSATTQFEDEGVMTGDLKNNYDIKPYHYYNIKIVTQQYLDDYKKDKYQSSTEEILKDAKGNMVGILSNDSSFLCDNLNENERNYFITKSLLWGTGLHGQTNTYADSFFYSKDDIRSNLSLLDKEAIKLLYGGRLSSGMKADEIYKSLDISIGKPEGVVSN